MKEHGSCIAGSSGWFDFTRGENATMTNPRPSECDRAILIVDDEADFVASLVEFLEDEGYAVRTAANGPEALEQLNSGPPPCLVILDLRMPVMSGNEVYAAMQKRPELASIPILVSSSLDASRAPAGALFMRKPIKPERMLDVIRRFC
jgi:CheY-like chemotaxis protein